MNFFSQTEFDQFTNYFELPKITNNEKETTDGLLAFKEWKKYLKSFKDNKSPGIDGFTVEFYWHCCDLIGPVVIESFNQAYEYR